MIGKDLEQSESQLRGAIPQLFHERGDSLKWFSESRTVEQMPNTKISVTGINETEVITPSHPVSFLPSSLMVLASQPSSFKASTPMRSPATCLRANNLRASSSKEKKLFGSHWVPKQWITHLSSCTALDQCPGRGHWVLIDWLYMAADPGPSSTHDCQFLPEPHDWSCGRGSPKDNDWRVV